MITREIKAVIFDLDGTLIHHQPSFFNLFLELIKESGYSSLCGGDDERKTRRWVHRYWAQSPESIEDFNKYGETSPDFWITYISRKLVGMGCSVEESQAISRQITPEILKRYQPETHIPADVVPTLEWIDHAGYISGLVSNRSDCFQEEIQQLGLAGLFDFAFTAGSIKSWKPDQKIFQHALELSGCEPLEAVYVGDNYYSDILGARGAGLQSILVDRHDVFPDADCPIIKQIGELKDLLP